MKTENPLIQWQYSQEEWNEFVDIEKANKKEDNIYFGLAILLIVPFGLMFYRGTSFLFSLLFSIPFAVLIPFLRMKFSYKHLQKNVFNPHVILYNDYMLINNHRIEVASKRKRIKNLKIIDAKSNKKLLEVDIQWATRKGPTNDEFRILIPENKLSEAEKLVENFYSDDN
ncbi:hypothetical protein [Polaribacter gangjinensis]|uniref:Uncharacterized protein n=1 Tax=Polaribacter gangjinensis TaxID=574710 RepID=A0A2S7WCE8_9FLAO|nr:hypothetical protein [Polaribacter gangjinensis]PQJ75300.1 hypothetical protein BTO13_08600 [Polaribacter gangjinensis]